MKPGASSSKSSRDAAGPVPPIHEHFMRLALEEARNALHLGEVPIGAVLADGREVIASGFNQPIHHVDPSAHAEIVALRRAAELIGNYRLPGTTLYVTTEPCLMCVGALVQARVSTIVYGVPEPKHGAVHSLLNIDALPLSHHFQVLSGVLEADCRKILQDFFRFKRDDT